jgi:hypothetical protein
MLTEQSRIMNANEVTQLSVISLGSILASMVQGTGIASSHRQE